MTAVGGDRGGSVAGVSYEQILAVEGFGDAPDGPVFVSGSIVTPFANPWSDIDAYVITDRGSIGAFTFREGANVVSQHYVADRRVDYEFWRPDAVRALADRLAGVEIGVSDDLPRQLFSYADECFMHRLRIGVPINDADGFEAWRASFDYLKLAAYMCQEVIRELDGVYEDVCGMLEGGDLDVAELSGRQLVGLAADCYLHKLGNTDPAVKWRPRYLELFDDGSSFHRELVEIYWGLEFPQGAGPGAPADERDRYVKACIGFSRRVTSWVQS